MRAALNVSKRFMKQAWELTWIKDALQAPLQCLPSAAFPRAADSPNRTALGAASPPLQWGFCSPQSAAGMPGETLPTWGWGEQHIPPQSGVAMKQRCRVHTQLIHMTSVTSINWQSDTSVATGKFPRDQYYIKQGIVKGTVSSSAFLRL